jgi:hypothetical protein
MYPNDMTCIKSKSDDFSISNHKSNSNSNPESNSNTNSLFNVNEDELINSFTDQNIDECINDNQSQNSDILLSYHDIQINLRLLSDLKEGEKIIIIDNKRMAVDNRYLQSIRRSITMDSRNKTLKFIGDLIKSTRNVCRDSVSNIKLDVNK